MFQWKKYHKNNKEFKYESRSDEKIIYSSKNVQILKVCVQSISQICYQCHVNLGYLFSLYGREESSSNLNEFVSL